MIQKILVDSNPFVFLFEQLFKRSTLCADVADYLKNIFCTTSTPILERCLFILGVTSLTFGSINFLRKQIRDWIWIPAHIKNNFCLNKQKLKERYGDCYVLITGFTQGIGRAYAEIFAEFGFNLFLISRSKEKVNKVVEELAQIYPEIKIKSAIVDLSNQEKFVCLDKILNDVAHQIDIGIIVNNAGSTTEGSYLTIKPESLVQDCNTNPLALFAINKALIPFLIKRQKRSAILNLSSCTGTFLASGLGVYSSAKRILNIYSTVLAQEHKDKIDVINITPFGVSTQMMGMKRGPLMITPRQCVLGSLADVLAGKQKTSTHLLHKVSETLFSRLSEKERFIFCQKLSELKNKATKN